MNWKDIELCFGNALAGVFSRKKLIATFIVLCLCGILTVFCRALSLETTPWISMSLIFLPILLSSGILLSLGVFLVKLYMHEVKGLSLSMGRLFMGSLDLMIGTSYLSIPPILAYLFLWIILGFFFLLKEIPLIGPFINVVLAFGPFLLIFSSIVLCLLNISLLFFIAPAAAHQTAKRLDLAKRVVRSVGSHPISAILLFCLGLIPSVVIGSLLTLSAIMTNFSFCIAGPTLAIALEWFFVMLPFCALMAPPVVFFFHFAAESYHLLQRK